jgi:putative endonuclease
MPNRHERGVQGEETAARFLETQGYRILARNFRGRRGELDLVAEEGDTLVFLEVKTRTQNRFGEPHWSVDRRKRDRIVRSATEYLARHRCGERVCRFDVLFLYQGTEPPKLELIRNAFEVGG